ncbi:MAG: T9SS type A sorting domain-containing protein [Bacteroidia bacterium]|nr:T9SS type A sorting domain-containing protein [Bacteroidia bacterium]
MKFKYILLITAIVVSLNKTRAQHSLQPTMANLVNNIVPGAGGNSNASTTCSKDTVYYPYYKATAFQAINVVNTSTSGNAFAQWYPAPQNITVSGFDFFAWAPNASTPVTVTCNLYNAGADSMPQGTPVRSVTVSIDSTFGGGLLSVLKKTAQFSTAYTTNAPYVITIENSSTNNVSVVANSWTATGGGNGRGEWLSSVRFSNNWVRSYNVNVSSVQFNADFVLMPHVVYTIAANFTVSNNCVDNNSTINFSNSSSPIFASGFYNRWVYFNAAQNSYYWNFGNGSSYSVNPSRTYSTAGNYNVLLTATQLGWIMTCVDTHSTNLIATPAAPSIGSNSPVCAGDSIVLTSSPVSGGTFSWTGPNSFVSNKQDSTLRNVNSSMGGTYGATVSVGGCTSQQSTLNVTVNAVPSTPSASNNGPLCTGQDLQLSTAAVSSASYSWTGPNSFTSTSQNPVVTAVTASNAGVYAVRVIVNGCASQPGSTTMSIGSAPAAPSVSNNGPLCQGQNLQLTASNSTNASYSWTGPNSFTSNQQNPSINGVSSANAGTYSCTVTVSGCGTSSAASTSVSITSLPSAPTAGNNGPICDGKTLSLTASTITGASYAWTGPAGFTSSNQNPVLPSFNASMAGNYSVTATVSGCGTSNAGTTAVVYNPGPSTPTVTSNGPLCSGSTLQLQATQITGTTYAWTGPNGFTSTLQNPVVSNVSPANSGSYSVTATIVNCATSPAGSIGVVVNDIPNSPNVSNNSPVCSGATLNLQASNITGATYLWTGPNGYSSTLQNPSISNVSGTNEGNYSVVAKVNGCSSPTVNISAVVNPKPNSPTAGKNGPACEGGDLNLTASSILNASYFWTGPNGFTSFVQNPTVTNLVAANSGTYSVTASVANCAALPSTLNINVAAKPTLATILGPTLGTRNGTSNYSVSFTNGSTYNWQITGGNQISGGVTNAITVQWADVAAGSVSVTETNQEGCVGNQVTSNVGLWYTGITPAPNASITVYPNPVKDVLYIKEVKEASTLVITNIIGKNVKEIKLTSGSQMIDVSDLPEGIYFLNFAEGITLKISKIK